MSDLATFADRGWSELRSGLGDPGHPFHTPVLATIGLGGGAEARTVVLRRADRADGILDVQSDAAATKVAEIRACPLATLLFWSPEAGLQIRARIEVEIVTGPALDAIWTDMPDEGRRKYGNTPPPGAPLAKPGAHAQTIDRARFAVLSGRITSLDLMDPGGAAPKRAIFRREDGFAGTWLAP